MDIDHDIKIQWNGFLKDLLPLRAVSGDVTYFAVPRRMLNFMALR